MKILGRFFDQKLNIKFTFVIVTALIIATSIFAGILFYSMEQSVLTENREYMENSMIRNMDAVETKIDPINISTQFFLTDEKMLTMLNRVAVNDEIETAEWVAFKNTTVVALERLVNTNSLLYGVRVYAENDQVQEMMPILYNKSRMEKQEWAGKEDYIGWNYDYTDNTFSSYSLSQSQKLVSLITPIYDSTNGRIGTIEAVMAMEDMFPTLYEEIPDEWSCFVAEDESWYVGESGEEEAGLMLSSLLEEYNGIENPQEIETLYLTQKGRHLVVSYSEVKELGGILVCVKDITENIQHVYRLRNLYVIGMIVFFVFLAFVINGIVRHLLRQFYDIMRAVRQVQKGDLDVRIAMQSRDEMGELSIQLNKMLDHIQKLMQDNIDRELLAKNSEIRALQNQINAHFIYNVLETIKMMAEIDEEYAISDAITALGKLLRYSMRWASGNVKVAEELEYIKNYVALINLRFDYEIILSLSIPKELMQQEIPKMSLQPIVENAILHGIEEVAEDTTIYIKGYTVEQDCVIEITDGGKGMNAHQVEELKKKIAGKIEASGGSGSGNGIGLKNVQDRIVMAFGRGYGLDIVSKEGCYTKVIVRLPESIRKRTPEELEVLRRMEGVGRT